MKLKQLSGQKSTMSVNWLNESSKIKIYYLAGINRAINPSQVTKLAESIASIGVIRPIVIAKLSFIDGLPKHYIIDGQHLYNSLLRMRLPVPYVIIDIEDKKSLVDKIALLNASSKNWCTRDYVTAWASLIPDYIKLNHYYNVYDFEIADISSLLMGNNIKAGGSHFKVLKRGEFRIVNEAEAVMKMDYITDVLKIVKRSGRMENKYLMSEYIKFLDFKKTSYNHKEFLEILKNNKDKFILAIQENGKLNELFIKITK